MKTVLYFSTDQFKTVRPSTKYVRIQVLATSHDNSTDNTLYQIQSEIYDADQLENRYANVTWLDDTEALNLGKQLQPERELIHDITGLPFLFEFELPEDDTINLAKVKMTDVKVPRGLEDMYDKLKEKGVLLDTDIPILESQIADKKAKRGKLNN